MRVVPQAAEYRDTTPLPLRVHVLRPAPLRGGPRVPVGLPRGGERDAGERQPRRARAQVAAHLDPTD